MPELPEVQTIVDDLNKKIVGRRIVNIWSDWQKVIKKPSFKDFQRLIKNKKIIKIERRAKNILIYLRNADPADDSGRRGQKSRRSQLKSAQSATHALLIHLKMTGHLLVGKWKIVGKKVIPTKPKAVVVDPYNQYIHLIFYLDDGRMIGFSDLRKFGKIMLGQKEQIENLLEIKKLGPEPLDKSLKFIKFVKLIKSERRKIKQVLMDQEVIAGIGNIYSDEILWSAKIHPFKSANKLTEKELKELWKATHFILKKALRLRGTSISDYRDTAGKEGGYDKVLLVYQREGKPCFRCKTRVKRIKLGGRSAHYCLKCQKL